MLVALFFVNLLVDDIDIVVQIFRTLCDMLVVMWCLYTKTFGIIPNIQLGVKFQNCTQISRNIYYFYPPSVWNALSWCIPFTSELGASLLSWPYSSNKSENNCNTNCYCSQLLLADVSKTSWWQCITWYFVHTVTTCPQIEAGLYCVYDWFNETQIRQKC